MLRSLVISAVLLTSLTAHAERCWTRGGDFAPCTWPDTGFRILETREKVVDWPSPETRAVYQAFRTLENTKDGHSLLGDILAAQPAAPVKSN